jgi:hypothetical protein
MTFGAMAAWQAWLVVAAAAGIAAGLFLLKVRPPRVRVPSLLLWRRVLDASRALTLWERIRRAVSLVVTVLVAVLLALAVARPSRAVGAATASAGRVLIVVDSSFSMLARTRSGETRWARAIAEARRLASGAAGGDVALATTADGLVEGPTADLALIETGLDRIAPSEGATAAWPQLTGAGAVHFITDGAIARPLGAGVAVHSVFEPAANAGITAFAVRPSLDRGAAGDAYLEVANFGPPQKVHVTLTRGAASLLDRQFDMAAGEALRQVVRLGRGDAPGLHARIDAPDDALANDNDAFASIERPRQMAVTVVGTQTAWLAPLFADDPGVTIAFVAPADYRPGREDAVIFDRWAPKEPPGRPAVYFAPPPETSWLAGPDGDRAGAAAGEKRPQWMSAGVHPVVRGVDPLTLTIEKTQVYGSPLLVPVARSARGTPLIYVRDVAAQPRSVIVTFGPLDSNLASAPGFPVLVGNALDWLARPAADAGRTANVGNPDVSNLSRTNAGATRPATLVGAGASARPWWVYCAVLAFALMLAEWWTWLRRITV